MVLSCRDNTRSETTRERTWRGKEMIATQAYPKIRAMVLDRHKRLYLGSTGQTRMLFMLLERAYVSMIRLESY